MQRIDGEALKAKRLSLDLTREMLAAASGGVSVATIARLERNEAISPQRRTVLALARALGCGLNDLKPAANGLQETIDRGRGRDADYRTP